MNGLRADSGATLRYQSERLRLLVRHAWENVPFYRRLYDDAGVDVASFRGLEDLEKLPVVTRRQLQESPAEDLISSGVSLDSLVTRKTSGSSGVPLTIRRTPAEDLFLQAVRLSARGALGIRPWERRARVSLVKRLRTGGAAPLSSQTRRRWLFPFLTLDAFAEPSQLARELIDYRPAVISGNPGFLERICTGATPALLEQIRPRVVNCGGETLQPGVRRLLEETWHAPVYDFYGAHEFNLVAFQREAAGSYELASLVTVGEVLHGEDDPSASARVAEGESGEFVGTALWSFAAPFIRYRLGDDVAAEKLEGEIGSCRSLRAVRGRVTDRFVTRDGGTIHAFLAVSELLTCVPWLRSYQMEQFSAGELLVRVAPASAADSRMREEARQRVAAALATKLLVDVQFVESLPRIGPAKRKPFIRHVPLP